MKFVQTCHQVYHRLLQKLCISPPVRCLPANHQMLLTMDQDLKHAVGNYKIKMIQVNRNKENKTPLRRPHVNKQMEASLNS